MRKDLAPEEKELVLKKAAALLERNGRLLFAYVFGSFIQGKPFEDLDLAVFPEEEPGRELLRMENELESSLGVRVELARLDKAPLEFAFRIIKEGRLIFSRDEKRRCDFEERTRDLYFDFQPFLRRYYQEAVLGRS